MKEFSEWYSWVCKEGKLVDLRYGVKGFPVLLPNAMIPIKEIYREWERILEADGHRPVLFPSVIPEKFFSKEAEHVEGFSPEVFWITEAGKSRLPERLALRPTSETAFYSMYSLWIQGKKDLPLKLYQSCQVWRYETKATRPFFRTREFLWIETHCAFADEEQALKQVKRDMEMTREILWERLAIPHRFIKRPVWDKFAGAEFTFGADTILPDGRFLQLPSTHYLGTRFAKAFDVKFMDEDGQEKYVHQTCHGPPLTRTFGALVSIHGDERGLVLPFWVAPVQVVVIPIPVKGKEKATAAKAKEISSRLGFRSVVDLSEGTPGEKFYRWELYGATFRVEVGPRELASGRYRLVRRDGKVWEVPSEQLGTLIREASEEFLQELKRRAKAKWERMVVNAEELGEIEEAVRSNKAVRIPFCSIGEQGRRCAEKLKEMGIRVRGEPLGEEKPVGKTCPVCGRKAEVYVLAGREY